MKAALYTDGGSRGNPGDAAIGYVLTLPGREPIEHGEYIGRTTNNQAEYLALLAGLKRAEKEGAQEVECFLDSELVVKQLAGSYRVRDAHIRPLYDQVCSMVSNFDTVIFNHVPREKNKRADMLVNKTLDKKTPRS